MRKNRLVSLIAGGGLAMMLGLAIYPGTALADGRVSVYKSPTCGCCTDWVDHLKENGFEVEVHDTADMSQVKRDAGLSPALASCHTAFVDGYVIEGHVPASDIRKLLEQASDVKGLAVPGMPAGSPGMEMGDRQDAFQVLEFNEAGQTRVFADYP